MRDSKQVLARSTKGKTTSHKKRKHQLAIEKAKRVQINEIAAIKPLGVVDKLNQIFGVSHAGEVSNCLVANEASPEKQSPQLAVTTNKEKDLPQANAEEGSEIGNGKFPSILDEDRFGQSETVSNLFVLTGKPTATSTPNTSVEIDVNNGDSGTFGIKEDHLELECEKFLDSLSSCAYLKAPLAREIADVSDEAGLKVAAKTGPRERDLNSVSRFTPSHQQNSYSVMKGLQELVNAGFTVHLSGQAFLGLNAPEPRRSRFEMRRKRTGKVRANKRKGAKRFRSRAWKNYHANTHKQKEAQEQLKEISITVTTSPHQLGTSLADFMPPDTLQNELLGLLKSTKTHCDQELDKSKDFHDKNIDIPLENISYINSGPPENMVFCSPPDDGNSPAQGGSMELMSEEQSSGIPHVNEVQDVPTFPEIHRLQILSHAALYQKLLAQCSSGLDPISLLAGRKKIT